MVYTYILLFAIVVSQNWSQSIFDREENWEKKHETKIKSIILRKLNKNLENRKLSNFSDNYSKSFIKRLLEEENKEKTKIVVTAEKVLNSPTEIIITTSFNTIEAQSTISTAKLFFYKKPTISESDVLIVYVKLNGSVVSTISVSNKYTGWLDADVSAALQTWVKYSNGKTNSFSLICDNCNGNYFEVSSENLHIPYLVINILKVKQLPRQQRKRWSCNQDANCCSRPVYVSFEDLSWNWVLSPKGFWTNKCMGNCKDNKQGINNCCIPIEHESITMFYYDNDYIFYAKKVNNIVTKECGCR
ncbi:inhibin beta B chain-like isoform X2 [Hydra vulgaris]|uniref:Inhibin beta B chain-like isoform X2 n=1 Tax=Hydra vulgaris TaxID=6087 RepID=A0ABM4BE10_HYDVU